MEEKHKGILFEGIVSIEELTSEPLVKELTAIGKFAFGDFDNDSLGLYTTFGDRDEEMQMWVSDRLGNAIVCDRAKMYRFKSDVTIKGDELYGPLTGWIVEGNGISDYQMLILTVDDEGLFKNPRKVCGVILSKGDIDYAIEMV